MHLQHALDHYLGIGEFIFKIFQGLFLHVNSQVGFRLAKGESLNDILATSDGVSEGVSTVLALEQMIKSKIHSSEFNIKFPVIATIARVVKGKLSPQLGMQIIVRFPLLQDEKY